VSDKGMSIRSEIHRYYTAVKANNQEIPPKTTPTIEPLEREFALFLLVT